MTAKRKTLTMLMLLLTRVALGGYFMLAGIAKVKGELEEFGSFYRGPFKSMQPDFLPNFIAAPYAYALPWVEVVVGAMLMLGLLGTISALLTGLMLLSFTVARMLEFGFTAQDGGAEGPFHANLILLPVAFLLACLDPGQLSLDRLMQKKKKIESAIKS